MQYVKVSSYKASKVDQDLCTTYAHIQVHAYKTHKQMLAHPDQAGLLKFIVAIVRFRVQVYKLF